MILVCGIPTETPLAMVIERLEQARADYVVFHQRTFMDCDMWFEIGSRGIDGELRLGSEMHRLSDITAVYQRMMDYHSLPELEGEAADSPAMRHCQGLHETLTQWMEIAPGAIVNRTAPMCTNGSKPYQIQLIREQGFLAPETLITNDPELVREFRAKHGRVIYKSASAVRSIVQTLDDSDMERLENIRWCPTQFQAYVPGMDVRVHTVGEEAYATAIRSEATDYRYAAYQVGNAAELEALAADDELKQRCLRLARSLGLEFAGIDLKFTPDGEVYCFEVNPCPAFSYFEHHSGQPISEGVARRLMAA